MEVLEIDGTRFVKASTIAGDLGYTADYVGQLCRSGKIDAHLVGRSWYVDEEALRAHRSEKSRSSQAKTKEALKEKLTEYSEEERPVAVRIAEAGSSASHNFYSKLTPKKVKYDEDRSELIPILSEKPSGEGTSLEVHVAGAEKLDIDEASSSYKMKATEKPKLRFSGDIKVATEKEVSKDQERSAGQGSDSEEKGAASVDKTTDRKDEDSKQNKTQHNVRLKGGESDGLTQSLPLKQGTVVAMTRTRPEQHAVKGTGNLKIASRATAPARPKRRQRRVATLLSLAVALCIGSVLALGLLAADQRIVSNSTEEAPESRYSIEPMNIVESIKGLK